MLNSSIPYCFPRYDVAVTRGNWAVRHRACLTGKNQCICSALKINHGKGGFAYCHYWQSHRSGFAPDMIISRLIVLAQRGLIINLSIALLPVAARLPIPPRWHAHDRVQAVFASFREFGGQHGDRESNPDFNHSPRKLEEATQKKAFEDFSSNWHNTIIKHTHLRLTYDLVTTFLRSFFCPID